jgi:hypothetical protein
VFSAAHSSFGHGGEVLATARVMYDPDEQSREVIETLEPGTRTVLHRGPMCHESLAVLGPGDVVALRSSEGYEARAELVRYTSIETRALARGHTLTGAHPAATAYGCVVSLPLVPHILVLTTTGELRQVDLGQ